MSAAVVLLFLLIYVLMSAWSARKQPAIDRKQPAIGRPTGNATSVDGDAADNFTGVTRLTEYSLRVTTDVSEDTTTSKWFAMNDSRHNGGNASDENSRGRTNSSERVESYMTFIIGVGINRYVLPAIIMVGSFGNLVSMFVMFQKQNRHTSFSIYLGCLAISDNCVLCGAAYYWWVSEIQVRVFLDVECKILVWMLDMFQSNGVLLILSVTLDRLVAVRFPFKAAAWCRARRATIVSTSVFVVVAVYNIPHLVLNHADPQLVCKLCDFDNTVCIVHSLVTLFIVFALPFVLLLSMNTVIVRVVRNAGKYKSGTAVDYHKETTTPTTTTTRTPTTTTTESIEEYDLNGPEPRPSVAQETTRRGSKNQLSAKDRNLIAMLLLVSFMFLLLNAPRFMRIVLFFTVHVEATPQSTAFSVLVFHVTNKLYFFNNACNFFLYCVSGSKFRRDFMKLFRENFSHRCCKRDLAETSSCASTQLD